MTFDPSWWTPVQTGLIAALVCMVMGLAWRLSSLSRDLDKRRDARDELRQQALLAHLSQLAENYNAGQADRATQALVQRQALQRALEERFEESIRSISQNIADSRTASTAALARIEQCLAEEAKAGRALSTKFFQHLHASLSKGPDRVVDSIQQHLTESTHIQEKIAARLESAWQEAITQAGEQHTAQLAAWGDRLMNANERSTLAMTRTQQVATQSVTALQQHLAESTHIQEEVAARSERVWREVVIQASEQNTAQLAAWGTQLIEANEKLASAIGHLDLDHEIDLKITQASAEISSAIHTLSERFREASVRNNEIDSFLSLHVDEATDDYLRKLAENIDPKDRTAAECEEKNSKINSEKSPPSNEHENPDSPTGIFGWIKETLYAKPDGSKK